MHCLERNHVTPAQPGCLRVTARTSPSYGLLRTQLTKASGSLDFKMAGISAFLPQVHPSSSNGEHQRVQASSDPCVT